MNVAEFQEHYTRHLQAERDFPHLDHRGHFNFAPFVHNLAAGIKESQTIFGWDCEEAILIKAMNDASIIKDKIEREFRRRG